MQNSMRQYCIRIDVCLLLQMPQHFDYKHEEGIKKCKCCDVCEILCCFSYWTDAMISSDIRLPLNLYVCTNYSAACLNNFISSLSFMSQRCKYTCNKLKILQGFKVKW